MFFIHLSSSFRRPCLAMSISETTEQQLSTKYATPISSN